MYQCQQNLPLFKKFTISEKIKQNENNPFTDFYDVVECFPVYFEEWVIFQKKKEKNLIMNR